MLLRNLTYDYFQIQIENSNLREIFYGYEI